MLPALGLFAALAWMAYSHEYLSTSKRSIALSQWMGRKKRPQRNLDFRFKLTPHLGFGWRAPQASGGTSAMDWENVQR